MEDGARDEYEVAVLPWGALKLTIHLKRHDNHECAYLAREAARRVGAGARVIALPRFRRVNTAIDSSLHQHEPQYSSAFCWMLPARWKDRVSGLVVLNGHGGNDSSR